MTGYLIAVVDTDEQPSGEYQQGQIARSVEVREHLYRLLKDHGNITRTIGNAQMIEEAETAVTLVDRWRGEPVRLCGYLVRYDVYPFDGIASEYAWRQLARDYEEKALRRAARERIRREWGLGEDDPDYRAVLDYLTDAAPHGTYLEMAARDLSQFYTLATWPDVAAAITPPYRPWQWAAATAATAKRENTSLAVIERELLAEIAARG